MNPQAIRDDLRVLILEAANAGIPLLVGTCGTAGTDSGVDWTAAIAEDIIRELGLKRKIARLYSEQSKAILKAKMSAGSIYPLPPSTDLTVSELDRCEHIVALMGPEPYMDALRAGADIVLGGRTTDTAVIAAVPLMNGAGIGASWHAAKISECGGQCTVNSRRGGVLISVGKDCFEVEPLDAGNQCTPETVSAHMLYENSDPHFMWEPGGMLDVSASDYSTLGDRITQVTGSAWIPGSYTMKLEGASAGPFQTIMIVGISDPLVLSNLDEFHDRMLAALTDRVAKTFGDDAKMIHLSLRIYGWNGTTGRPVPKGTAAPLDAGVMFVATAPNQELANQVAKACNPMFFHMPLRSEMELPSYAFPFTPAEIPRGQVFQFELNHVVHTESPNELVRMEIYEYGPDARGAMQCR